MAFMMSFDELWKAMERRRQHYDAGQLPLAHAYELARQALRHEHGCPPDETLCGFVEGQLWKTQLWLWVKTWWHIVIKRCAYCCQDVAAFFLDESTRSIWAALCARRMDPPRRTWTPLCVFACVAAVLVLVSVWRFWPVMPRAPQPELASQQP